MLTDTLKARILDAMKRRDELEKNILQVALGDIQTTQSRDGKTLDDEGAAKVLRKIVKANNESLAVVKDDEARKKLERENEILESLLPKTLRVEEIMTALQEVADDIRGAGNDGQATGIAMKHLKGAGANVDGRDVAGAVKQIRQGSGS